jgi:hypothetical protein
MLVLGFDKLAGQGQLYVGDHDLQGHIQRR